MMRTSTSLRKLVLVDDLESLIDSSVLKKSADEAMVTGYVKGVATFMVMDDLMVKPMSTITNITLLNTFNVKDVSLLQEKTVNIDIKKGLELVKASFGSTTVLTDVFLEELIA
ncbi:uncharacterized protein LOC133878075 [Alnus glutinosa]|uniref:uncharacterized protein LOC133878075 n=1 Tax=Alnus glutinosa TaxID=3517 RepID=UPI002D7837E5|nr:uncharacterized protein LOC133878075 [Alnus glutinosa]